MKTVLRTLFKVDALLNHFMINFGCLLKLPTIDGNLMMFCQKKSSVVAYVYTNNNRLELAIPHEEGLSLTHIFNMNVELEGVFFERKINLCIFKGFTADLVLYLLRLSCCFVKIFHDFELIGVFM